MNSEIKISEETQKQIDRLLSRLSDLQAKLSSDASDVGDWKIIKYQEYILAGKEAPYNITELDSARQAIRDEINSIKAKVKELDPRYVEF